jgi:hypothetical protein
MIAVDDQSIEGDGGDELYDLDAAVFATHPELEVLVRPPTAQEARIAVPTTEGDAPTRLVAIVRLLDGRLCRFGLPVLPTNDQLIDLARTVRARFASMN